MGRKPASVCARDLPSLRQLLPELPEPGFQGSDTPPESLVLAKQRCAAFVELVKSHPQQALESSVPAAILRRLPTGMAAEMESRVSGIGDFLVLCALQAVGGPTGDQLQQIVRLNVRACLPLRATADGGF